MDAYKHKLASMFAIDQLTNYIFGNPKVARALLTVAKRQYIHGGRGMLALLFASPQEASVGVMK